MLQKGATERFSILIDRWVIEPFLCWACLFPKCIWFGSYTCPVLHKHKVANKEASIKVPLEDRLLSAHVVQARLASLFSYLSILSNAFEQKTVCALLLPGKEKHIQLLRMDYSCSLVQVGFQIAIVRRGVCIWHMQMWVKNKDVYTAQTKQSPQFAILFPMLACLTSHLCGIETNI